MRGIFGQLAYVLMGAVGLPFYSRGASGFEHVLGATGGFLVGFIPAAFLVGLAARRGLDRSTRASPIGTIPGPSTAMPPPQSRQRPRGGTQLK